MKQIVKNRKANFEYTILDTYTAGMILSGEDVKFIRNGKINISDSFCYISNGEIFLQNVIIDATNTSKKLLLNKKEICTLKTDVEQKGLTIVPLEIFDNNGLLKMKIALAKGKTLYDKKQTIKEKDIDRETWRLTKNY